MKKFTTDTRLKKIGSNLKFKGFNILIRPHHKTKLIDSISIDKNGKGGILKYDSKLNKYTLIFDKDSPKNIIGTAEQVINEITNSLKPIVISSYKRQMYINL